MRSMALVVIFLTVHFLVAQEQIPQPVPYSPDEFPRWARDLSRFEAIIIGAIPVTLLLGGIVYDIYRLSEESVASGSFRTDYLPQIVNPSRQYSNDEQLTVFYITISLAVAVALADLILGIIQRERGTR